MIKGDLKFILNLNKSIFRTCSLPLTLLLFYCISQGVFLGREMKLQDLCGCTKGTEHTFYKINITSIPIAKSQVWLFICYYNTLVKSKSV